MRPGSVPEGAVLLEAVINGKKCPYWELGQKKDGKIVCEVRWWRSDGQLWGFENHDSSGVMHGLKESYQALIKV